MSLKPVASLLSLISLPLRYPRRYIAHAMVFMLWLALVAVVLATDQPVEAYWDRLAGNVAVADGLAVFLTLVVNFHFIGLGLLLLTMLDKRLNWSFMRWSTMLMLGQAALCSTLKQLFGRLRPDAAAEATIFYGPSMADLSFSFPSGHATASWTMAGILSTYYPRWKWLFMIAALAICLARIQLDRHFPSDTLAGGLLGWYLATGTLRWLRRGRKAGEVAGEASDPVAA